MSNACRDVGEIVTYTPRVFLSVVSLHMLLLTMKGVLESTHWEVDYRP